MDGNPLEAAQALITDAAHALIANAQPPSEDMQAALGFLRAAFITSLRNFCQRKHVRVPYQNQAIEIKTLWKAIKDNPRNLFPPPYDSLFNQIEAEKNWLILPITETDLTELSLSDLLRIAGVLAPTGSSQMVLDAL